MRVAHAAGSASPFSDSVYFCPHRGVPFAPAPGVPLDSDPAPSEFGFPRDVRLTQSTQFNAVFKQRFKTFRRSPVRIVCKPNRMPSARLGLVIAKRMIPKAHNRNRIKRVIRDAFRHRRADLPSWDLVVQLTEHATAKQVRAAMDQIMQDIEQYAANHPT